MIPDRITPSISRLSLLSGSTDSVIIALNKTQTRDNGTLWVGKSLGKRRLSE